MLRLLRLGAAHATELPYVWGNLVAGPKDPTFKLGGLKAGRTVSARLRTRWLSFAVDGEAVSARGDPAWRPYRKEDRATLLIDAQDGWSTIWTATCGPLGAMKCSASAE